MSYILDALKKSEQERQQNQAPTVHSIYAGARLSGVQSQTPWLLITLTVLIVSGLVVSGFWWYSTSQKPVGVPTVEAVVTEIKPPVKTVPEQKPLPEKNAGLVTKTDTEVATVAADMVSKSEPVDDEQELLPVMQLVELPDDVRNSLPPMTYSFHVFSTDKTKCTIIINNRRYREGELIGSGWLLDSITETGIIVRKARYRAAIQVVDSW